MEIKTTPIDGIRYVQYKLFDFTDGRPKPVNEVIHKRLAQNPVRMSVPQIELRDEDHFEAVNPVCPRCGSTKVTKQDWRKRSPKLSEFKTITIYYRRYKCRKCGKKFPTQMDGIVKKGRQYSEFFREKANALAGIVKYSARTTQRALLSLFGISPSHQTI
jgi:transposase-like protein